MKALVRVDNLMLGPFTKFSIEIPLNSLVFVTGSNNSGKSLLLKVLAGLVNIKNKTKTELKKTVITTIKVLYFDLFNTFKVYLTTKYDNTRTTIIKKIFINQILFLYMIVFFLLKLLFIVFLQETLNTLSPSYRFFSPKSSNTTLTNNLPHGAFIYSSKEAGLKQDIFSWINLLYLRFLAFHVRKIPIETFKQNNANIIWT